MTEKDLLTGLTNIEIIDDLYTKKFVEEKEKSRLTDMIISNDSELRDLGNNIIKKLYHKNKSSLNIPRKIKPGDALDECFITYKGWDLATIYLSSLLKSIHVSPR